MFHYDYHATQREILRQSQVEISRREPWSANAAVLVEEDDDFWTHRWRVKAGAYDWSDYPKFNGIYFVPGTERELEFTRKGCLVSYSNIGKRCVTDDTMTTDPPMVPSK